MVKKKMSGQTIAIIILAVLLVLAIGFGGVYAFYSNRSNKVSGKIIMANLKIDLDSGNSDKSEIVISNGENVVPNQALDNTPLTVENLSTVAIYVMVVYEVTAVKSKSEEVVNDAKIEPVLDLGFSYVNEKNNIQRYVDGQTWVDYVFTSDRSGEEKSYRVLMSTQKWDKETDIEVIGKNKLKISKYVNNDYQDTTISFTFQAYAIGVATFNFEGVQKISTMCNTIANAVYESENYRFLQANATT